MFDCVRVFQDAIEQVTGAPSGPPRFAWHDKAALTDLFAPLGFRVAVDEHQIAFSARSARDYFDTRSRTHPVSIADRTVLESAGAVADAIDERALGVLEAANEDHDGFRVTSGYVVAQATRGSSKGRSSGTLGPPAP